MRPGTGPSGNFLKKDKKIVDHFPDFVLSWRDTVSKGDL
jgi:hypothetical protein